MQAIVPSELNMTNSKDLEFKLGELEISRWDGFIMDISGIPPKFRNLSLSPKPSHSRVPFKPHFGYDHFGSDKDQAVIASKKEAHQKIIAIRDNYISFFLRGQKDVIMDGLLLSGNCGTGKTHWACAFLSDLIYSGICNVRYLDFFNLVQTIRNSFTHDANNSEKALLNDLCNYQVLVMDDFNQMYAELSGWDWDYIRNIINERYKNRLPTIFLTSVWDDSQNNYHSKTDAIQPGDKPWNSNLNSEDKIGVRGPANPINYDIKSRIMEMCNKVNLPGKDIRPNAKKSMELKSQLSLEQLKNDSKN